MKVDVDIHYHLLNVHSIDSYKLGELNIKKHEQINTILIENGI
jgi:hypothetical protein